MKDKKVQFLHWLDGFLEDKKTLTELEIALVKQKMSTATAPMTTEEIEAYRSMNQW